MSVTLKSNKLTPSLLTIERKLALVPKEAYAQFVADTPVRSGNARRRTKLVGNKIVAGYNYAKKLDEGFSKQAPEGMTRPTEEFIKNRIAAILRGK
jgi:hypothetical protein